MKNPSLITGYWKFTFEAPINERVMRYGRSVTVVYDKTKNTPWFNEELNKWDLDHCNNKYHFSSHSTPVKTFKAFKRHLRKHHAILKDFEVVWCNMYHGYDVRAEWIECLPFLN